LLAGRFNLKGALWDLIGTLNDNFNNLGFVIIGVFIVAWVASFAIYRVKGYDELPVRAAE
jgi:high-affinity nickel-transport protein